MNSIKYTGLYAGKVVTMSIPEMARLFDRSKDFIRRHLRIAQDKGIDDVIAHVCMKSNTLRRNEKGVHRVGKRVSNVNGKRTTAEDKFVFTNKVLFNRFILPFNTECELKREG